MLGYILLISQLIGTNNNHNSIDKFTSSSHFKHEVEFPMHINDSLKIKNINNTTFEPFNRVELNGQNFIKTSYPKNYGAYYEFSSNVNDLFDNFPSAKVFGKPNFKIIENVKTINFTDDSYLELPKNIDSGILFNNLYDNDFSIGFWTYIDENLFTKNGDISPLITDINNNYGFFAKKENEAIKLYINLGSEASTTRNLKPGWNKILLNTKTELNETSADLYINNSEYYLANFNVDNFKKETNSDLAYYLGKTNSKQTINPILANFYFVPKYINEKEIHKFINKPPINIVLFNKNTNQKYNLSNQWILSINDKNLAFTLPNDLIDGDYYLKTEISEISSNPIDLQIKRESVRLEPFSTKFENEEEFLKHFNIQHRAWGGANGGVVKENVEHSQNNLRLYANGDLYSGEIQGVNFDGTPKFHNHKDDPNLGEKWTYRVGSVVTFKEKTGFGSYIIKAKIPTELGVAAAFWTFFYNEIYPNDIRWEDSLEDGLHPQGSLEDGYYITRNHEIDIEFPSHLPGGNPSEPSFNNMKNNTWRGELKNYGTSPHHPNYWEEFKSSLVPTGINMYDGKEHEFRFDWHEDRVEFYIDGKLKQVHKNTTKSKNIPTNASYFSFGLWFPSTALPKKPWLADPEKAWAGGLIDKDGGRKAMFDRVYMDISSFSFTPFDNSNIVNTGETYRIYD